MSLTAFKPTSKANARLRPNQLEGRHIKYVLSLHGTNFKQLSEFSKVSQVTVSNVVYGRRRSARVEAEIARILGKSSWSDVVSEARLATREFSPAVFPATGRSKRRAS